MKTFRVLGALLDYPDEALVAAVPELRAAIADEGLLPPDVLRALGSLLDAIEGADPLDLAERHVDLFERSRALSLHLFEHVHGESRDRGQAMIDLLGVYERHGFGLVAAELPDYLPLFLEFLSLLPLDEARALLAEPAHILAALAERLERRGSPYAAVLRAAMALAAPGADAAAGAPATAEADAPDAGPGGPDDLARLDAEWEETAVSFGPAAPGAAGDGCGRAAEMLRRMGLPAAPARPVGQE